MAGEGREGEGKTSVWGLARDASLSPYWREAILSQLLTSSNAMSQSCNYIVVVAERKEGSKMTSKSRPAGIC
jgi:hypothetical protein